MIGHELTTELLAVYTIAFAEAFVIMAVGIWLTLRSDQ